MDIHGHESIVGALQQAGIEASVEPVPVENEQIEYVTVTAAPELAPAVILNALAKASILAVEGPSDAVYRRSGPQLQPLFGHRGSVTFTDTNNRHRGR